MINISNYTGVALFGTVNFLISELKVTRISGTSKSNIGKTFIEKEIPSRNKNDIVLTIKGVITGLSKQQGETDATAIDRDRTALIALDDGFYHLYNDGKHIDKNMVIVKGSLVWDDDSIKDVNENAQEFSIVIKEW